MLFNAQADAQPTLWRYFIRRDVRRAVGFPAALIVGLGFLVHG
jgi:hypothetical protein